MDSTIKCGLLDCLRDQQVRYANSLETVSRWFRHRASVYTLLSLEDIPSVSKRSETLFVIGGGESINTVSAESWDHISRHDSFGMNWWPVHPFAPTYYYTNYPRDRGFRSKLAETIQSRKDAYSETVFFVSRDRAILRGMHPRVLPEFFSENPICCCYEYPIPLQINAGEVVSQAHFEHGVYYRGALTLVLHLGFKLGYRRIVLVGVDLHNSAHFYDSYPECRWMVRDGYVPPLDQRRIEVNWSIDTKDGSKIPIDQFLYSANELFFQPAGVELFVVSPESRLAGRIPIYGF